jgi:hypothetical protein
MAEVSTLIRLLAVLIAVASAWIALMFARRLVDGLRSGTLRLDPLKPKEHRINYLCWMFFFGVGTTMLTLTAVEAAYYAATGAPAGIVTINGRPLGEP